MLFSWGYLEAKYILIFRKENIFSYFLHTVIIIHYFDGIIEANDTL